MFVLTVSPKADAPLGPAHSPVFVGVTRVEEGPDADLVLVQVNGVQLRPIQNLVFVRVQSRKHPTDGFPAAG